MSVMRVDRQVGEGLPTPRPLVLAVDDSADMRYLLGEVLGSAGYEVVGVPSAEQALRIMLHRVPDLLITDLLMPGMSGFALRAEMLKRPPLESVPVIILSGYWRRPSETLDASAVLPKPLNIDELVSSVSRLVRRT